MTLRKPYAFSGPWIPVCSMNMVELIIHLFSLLTYMIKFQNAWCGPFKQRKLFCTKKGFGDFLPCLLGQSSAPGFWNVGSSPRELENGSIRTSKTFAYSPVFILKCLKISPGLC